MTAVDPVRENGSVAGHNKSVESPTLTGMFDVIFAESAEGVALQPNASDTTAFIENAPLIPQPIDGNPTPEGNLDFSIISPYFPIIPAEQEVEEDTPDTPDLALPTLTDGDTIKSMEGSVEGDEATVYASLPRADLDISGNSNAPIPVVDISTAPTVTEPSTSNLQATPESDLNNSDSHGRSIPSQLVNTPLPTSVSELPTAEGGASSNITPPPVQGHTQDIPAEQLSPLKDKGVPLTLRQQNSVNAPIKTAPEPLKADTPSPAGKPDIQSPLSNNVNVETRPPSQTVRQRDYDSITLVHSKESKERASAGQQNSNNSSTQPVSALQKTKIQGPSEHQNATNYSAVDEGVSQTFSDTDIPVENDAFKVVTRAKSTDDGAKNVSSASRGTPLPPDMGESFQLPPAPPQEVTSPQQAATQVALSPSLANVQMTLDTRNAQWRSRMVEHTVTRAADGAESIDISFRPKNLGDIHLQVEVKNNETQLRVVAETHAAARLLLANEDILSRLMDQAGLRLSNVSVQVGGQGLGMGQSMAQNSNGQSDANDRSPRKDVIRGATTSTPRAQSNAIMDDHANGIVNVLA